MAYLTHYIARVMHCQVPFIDIGFGNYHPYSLLRKVIILVVHGSGNKHNCGISHNGDIIIMVYSQALIKMTMKQPINPYMNVHHLHNRVHIYYRVYSNRFSELYLSICSIR